MLLQLPWGGGCYRVGGELTPPCYTIVISIFLSSIPNILGEVVIGWVLRFFSHQIPVVCQQARDFRVI